MLMDFDDLLVNAYPTPLLLDFIVDFVSNDLLTTTNDSVNYQYTGNSSTKSLANYSLIRTFS